MNLYKIRRAIWMVNKLIDIHPLIYINLKEMYESEEFQEYNIGRDQSEWTHRDVIDNWGYFLVYSMPYTEENEKTYDSIEAEIYEAFQWHFKNGSIDNFLLG